MEKVVEVVPAHPMKACVRSNGTAPSLLNYNTRLICAISFVPHNPLVWCVHYEEKKLLPLLGI